MNVKFIFLNERIFIEKYLENSRPLYFRHCITLFEDPLIKKKIFNFFALDSVTVYRVTFHYLINIHGT